MCIYSLCNEAVALGHKDQAKTGGWMPLWHLHIPILRNGGTCTPSLWLFAHSVRAHTGYLSQLVPNLYHYTLLLRFLRSIMMLGVRISTPSWGILRECGIEPTQFN
eukprot:1156915-Pelagomonas_calceolata.AAC.10